MEQNKDLSNQFQNLSSHFEKGKREDSLSNFQEKVREGVTRFRDNEFESQKELRQEEVERSKFFYRRLTHICHEVIRVFETDSPIKCSYCGEEVK